MGDSGLYPIQHALWARALPLKLRTKSKTRPAQCPRRQARDRGALSFMSVCLSVCLFYLDRMRAGCVGYPPILDLQFNLLHV